MDLGSEDNSLRNAVQYLMNYLWLIIIAVVIVAVFLQLGIFSGFLSDRCIVVSGYLCRNPVLTNTGQDYGSGLLTLQFGHIKGITVYNARLVVSSLSQGLTASGFPNDNDSAELQENFTYDSGTLYNVSIDLGPDELTRNSVGTVFSGYLWLAYNSGSPTGQRSLERIGSVTYRIK